MRGGRSRYGRSNTTRSVRTAVWDTRTPKEFAADTAERGARDSNRRPLPLALPHPGSSQATYYLWKRKYTGVGVSELRELRQLREEVGRLKRLVADLSLDRQMLQEIVSKKL